MKQLFALALILSASPLAAQQVVSVTSGDHSGFSRLVLQIDPDVDWEIIETHGLATVQFPLRSLTFSTSNVFDKMSTARIISLSEINSNENSQLQVELNCSCKVQSFAFNDNYIVIDVFDGPALGPLQTAVSEPQWQPDALPFIQRPHAPSRFTAFVMAQSPMQPELLPDPPPKEAPVPTPQMHEPALPDMVAEVAMDEPSHIAETDVETGVVVADMNEEIEVEDDPEMLARIEEAQNQLLAQLTRAADQGLVDFVPAPVPVAEVLPAPEPVPMPEPTPEPLSAELLQQLSARTAYSQGTEDALTAIVNQFAMPQCLDDADFTMAGWGGEAGFSAELAHLRSSLLGEFDTIQTEVAKDIVQLYLRYGLGAEARLTLSEIGADLEESLLYSDMASLIESEPARVAGPVLKGAGCGGAHELWYLVTGLGDYQVLEPLAITEIFSNYPIEVRTLIGPPLAQAFIARGQVEAGHVVLEIVRRAESGVTPQQRLAEAHVMEVQGNLDGAIRVYRELALGNGEQAPEALISYARTLLASDQTLPETLLVDLESAAFFNRHAVLADPLRLWEIRVRAEVAGADAALTQIEEMLDERPDLSMELRSIITDIFANSSAARLGDYAYAQMVLRFADLLDQSMAGDAARLKIAEEMAAMGLPETALEVLAPNLGRATADVHYVEAAAYVQLFQPNQALAILDEDTSLTAYKIRLSAYLQMEDFAAVAQMLNEEHAKEISLNDIALRAGDWAKIQDAGAVGTLASYVQGEVPPEAAAMAPIVAQEAPSLKAARALLANSEDSMRFLEGVLAEHE